MVQKAINDITLRKSTQIITPTSDDLDQLNFMHAEDNKSYIFKILISEFFSSYKKIFLTFFSGIMLTLITLFLIGPDFKAESTLLVLLSPDYSPHAAGEDVKISSIVLERDAVLKDEVEIISSRSLAKTTIQSIGLQKIYPELGVNPGIFRNVINVALWPINFIKSLITGVKMRDIDPLEYGVTKFLKNLNAQPDKSGNIIKLTFTHHDPKISSEVLNTHLQSYLSRRIELYRDLQSTVLIEHVKDLGTKLDSIYESYETFKLNNNISDYNTQRQILLHQRGEISQDLQQAERLISQNLHKSKFLQKELDLKPNDTVQYHDKLTQIRRGRPQVLDTLEVDKLRADQELISNQARKDSDTQQLTNINSDIELLDRRESSLERIDRSRRTAEESYHTAIKALTDREMHENLMDNKTENVRVIQPAEIPLSPTNLRLILAFVGTILSALLATLTGVFIFLTRKGFICASTLEKTLQLPVLASVTIHS